MSTTTRKTSKASRSTDADRVRDMLMWCRARGVHVQRIRIGDVELDGIADRTALGGSLADAAATPPVTDIRRQFGGDALDRLHRETGDGPNGGAVVVEEDD